MNVLIADDHALLLDVLKSYIEKASSTAVVTTATSFDAVLDAVSRTEGLEMVVLSLELPGMQSMEDVAALRAIRPDLRVALTCGPLSPNQVNRAIELGISGILPKTLNGMAMVSAMQLIHAGETFVPWSYMHPAAHVTADPRLAWTNVKPVPGLRAPERAPERPAASRPDLTLRQQQVLDAILLGQSNKEIANSLDLSEVTVKLHLRTLYRKLGVKSRLQAAQKIGMMAPTAVM